MNFVPFHFINDVTDHLPYFDLNKILLISSSWSANYCHKTRREKTPLELRLLVHPTGLSCSLYALTNKGQYERFVDVAFLQNDYQEMVFLTICATAETGVTRLITDMDYQILLDFLKLQKTPLQKVEVIYANNLPEKELLQILSAVPATSVLTLNGELSFGDILSRTRTIGCIEKIPESVESTILEFIKTSDLFIWSQKRTFSGTYY